MNKDVLQQQLVFQGNEHRLGCVIAKEPTDCSNTKIMIDILDNVHSWRIEKKQTLQGQKGIYREIFMINLQISWQ